MADSVQKRILGQCRNALLGGVPILYIKTDSHILIQKLLLDNGIIIRNRSLEPLLSGCLRITIGSRAENDKLLEVLCNA